MPYTIGLISDTHGLLRPAVHTAFSGVDLILHAGDVGGRVSAEDILLELRTIAPVLAVYGNCDSPGHLELQREIDHTVEGVRIHVQHGHELGRPGPAVVAAAYDADLLVYGHTHIPALEVFGKKTVVNPGAAGPKRFEIKASVARAVLSNGHITIEHIPIE